MNNTSPKQPATPRDQQANGVDLNPGGQKGHDPRRNPGGQMGQGRPGEEQTADDDLTSTGTQTDRSGGGGGGGGHRI